MARNRFKLFLYGGLTAAVMIFIFCMSAQDGTESGSLSEWVLNTRFGQIIMSILPGLTGAGDELDIRKYAHMSEYALLAVCSVFFFRELLLEYVPKSASASSFVLCFLYACSDEFHQSFVPGRAGLFSDVLIDSSGALIAILLVFFCFFVRKDLK